MSDAAIRLGLATLLDTEVLAAQPQRIEGGCINQCYRYETKRGSVFVKVAPHTALDMFQAEAASLMELQGAKAARVPQVLGAGVSGEISLLALQWIDLQRSSAASDAKFGEQLAQQHRNVKPLFGFKRNNFIGATPQINFWSRSWINFWREHRFEAQLNLAEQNGANAAFTERAALLSTMMDGFFATHTPIASLLHGDLWGGNCAADAFGAPVIFDPAVYYGDRECDIAMTKLFGGFSRDFYAAYEDAWPLPDGWQQRIELYNVYHVLNHFNLFGGGYLAQAEAMIEKLLSELGH
ncbi:MAG TPA: fructosamine kinase family protein [Steroidobacteraceae bacterium]|nr:fructosamine kinase family protein [Steroidobacteraceae bacterium]